MTSAQAPSSTICPSCQQSQSDPDADFCQSCRFPLLPIANKYRLEQLLNEGGFSHVYLARHIRLKRNAERVIKIIKGDLLQRDPSMEERFYREVQMTADLSHQCQHVVRVFDDFGDAPKLGHYYVMEYLQGGTLAELMKSAHELLSFEVAVHIASQLCDAMHWAHKSDIIHRDLKPANIMLIDYEGDAHYVKVLDFGIAKSFAEEHAEGKQFTQGAIGTPTYMAPEHFKGGEVDFRADLYSLGVIFYELLAGRPPFLRQNNFQSAMIEMMEYHTNSPVPPLQEFRPEIPQALADAVHKALAKQPEDRFGSAREFKEALQTALAPQAGASHPGMAIPPATASGSFPRATPSGTHPAAPSGSFSAAPSGSFAATPTPPPATSSGSFAAAPSGSLKATPSGSFKATSSGSFNAASGSFSAAGGSFPPRSVSGSYPASPSGSYPPPPPKRKTGSHAAKPPPPPPSYSRSSMPAVGQGGKDAEKPKDAAGANDTHTPGFPGIPSPTTPVKKPEIPKEVLPPQPFKSLGITEEGEGSKKSGKISLRLDNRLVEGAQITMDPQAEPLTIDDIEEAQSEDDLDSTAVLTADDITMSFRRQDAERVSAAILSTEDITTAHLTTKKDLGSTGILTAEDMTTETRRLLDIPEADGVASPSEEVQVPSLGSHATPSISAPTDAPDAAEQSAGTSPNLAPTSVEETISPEGMEQSEPSDSSEDPATAALMKLLDPLAQAQTELGVADTTIQANPFLSDPHLFELATGTRPPDLRPDNTTDESPAEAASAEEEPETGTIETTDDADSVEDLAAAGATPTVEEGAQDSQDDQEAASLLSDADRALAAVESSFTTVTPPPPATPEEITAEYFSSPTDALSASKYATDEAEADAPTVDPLAPEAPGPRVSEQETTKVHGIQVPMELLTGEISDDALDSIDQVDDEQGTDGAETKSLEETSSSSLETLDASDASEAEEDALDVSAALDALDEAITGLGSSKDADNHDVDDDHDHDDEDSGASSTPPVDLSSTVQFHPNLPLPPKVEASTPSQDAISHAEEGDRSTLEYDQPAELLPGPSFDDILAADEGIAMSSMTVGFETPGASANEEKPPAPFGALLASAEEADGADDANDTTDNDKPEPEASVPEDDSSNTDFAELLGPDMYHEAVSDAELLSMEALLDQASKKTTPPAPAPPQEPPRSEEQSTLEVHALSLDGDDPFGLLEDDSPIQSSTVEAGAFEPGAFDDSALEPGTIESNNIEPDTMEPKSVEPDTMEPGAIEPGTIESESIEPGTVEEAPALDPSDAPAPPFGRDPFARFSDSAELHTLDRDQPSHETLEQPEPASEAEAPPTFAGFGADMVPPDATQEIAAPPPSVIIAQAAAESSESEDEIEYPSLLSTQGTVPKMQAVAGGEQRPGSGQQSNHMPIIVLMLVGGVLLLIGAFMML